MKGEILILQGSTLSRVREGGFTPAVTLEKLWIPTAFTLLTSESPVVFDPVTSSILLYTEEGVLTCRRTLTLPKNQPVTALFPLEEGTLEECSFLLETPGELLYLPPVLDGNSLSLYSSSPVSEPYKVRVSPDRSRVLLYEPSTDRILIQDRHKAMAENDSSRSVIPVSTLDERILLLGEDALSTLESGLMLPEAEAFSDWMFNRLEKMKQEHPLMMEFNTTIELYQKKRENLRKMLYPHSGFNLTLDRSDGYYWIKLKSLPEELESWGDITIEYARQTGPGNRQVVSRRILIPRGFLDSAFPLKISEKNSTLREEFNILIRSENPTILPVFFRLSQTDHL